MQEQGGIQVFIRAAREILEAELALPVEAGPVSATNAGITGSPVVALVGMTGDLEGMVGLGVSNETACAIAGAMLGEQVEELTPLVESAIGELCNVVAGRTSALLQEHGYHLVITPPVIITGEAVRLSTSVLPRVSVPLRLSLGTVELKVAAHLADGRQNRLSRPQAGLGILAP